MERVRLESLDYEGIISIIDTKDKKIKEKEIYIVIRQDKYNTCISIDDLHISLSNIGFGMVKRDD